MPDVVIVGGGIIGCSVAFALGKTGVRPLVLEKSSIAAEASSGGAGLLSAQVHTDEPGPLFDLKLASRNMYPLLAEELRELADADIELRPLGHLAPAFTPEGEAVIRQRVSWQSDQGLRASWLPQDDARVLESGLPPEIRGAGWFPDDHHLNPTAVTQALATATRRLGGELRTDCPVRSLIRDGQRIIGVRTATGKVSADTVVLCAGAWSGEFQESAGVPIPVFPAKGQIVVARLPEPTIRRVVYEDIYVIPRANGEHIIGSTVEYVGFDKRTTVEGIAGLLTGATALVPALGEAEMVASYGCLRPASSDALPLLGPVPDRPGLILATGHFRNGILLAPITGRLIADMIVKRKPTIPLEPFRPDRPFPPSPQPRS